MRPATHPLAAGAPSHRHRIAAQHAPLKSAVRSHPGQRSPPPMRRPGENRAASPVRGIGPYAMTADELRAELRCETCGRALFRGVMHAQIVRHRRLKLQAKRSCPGGCALCISVVPVSFILNCRTLLFEPPAPSQMLDRARAGVYDSYLPPSPPPAIQPIQLRFEDPRPRHKKKTVRVSSPEPFQPPVARAAPAVIVYDRRPSKPESSSGESLKGYAIILVVVSRHELGRSNSSPLRPALTDPPGARHGVLPLYVPS